MLGRKGVLELNAVANVNQLDQVRAGMQSVLGFVEFQAGQRYSDFDPKVDKVAAYGIGALIAGKLAVKAGLLKGLVALLIAGKKFVVVAVVAIGAAVRSLFFGNKVKPSSDAAATNE